MRSEQAFTNQNNPEKQPFKKRWIAGLRRAESIHQNTLNGSVSYCYRDILTKAKQLLKEHEHLVFEKDFRYDNNDNAFILHAFISSTLYFILECELCYDYKVDYAFNNCPVEAEIRKLLQVYPINERANEVKLRPDFNTFYHNTLRYQPSQYIYSLKA
ncbi:hypothetical protein MUY27_13920 [Mucilaginibacter sp. RS28]|uniref:Uncharacterized protein n=1 Tax=Mucilaginibacter straminoryzae TaxID=2932774 RepID=A0A9X2BAH3_9SPHI|nr:hypothetical protein [Mucilaginibacter straminoryzae]MCJ8210810.1 hypothetical protein [Mucilaginibacter straminoryzae]